MDLFMLRRYTSSCTQSIATAPVNGCNNPFMDPDLLVHLLDCRYFLGHFLALLGSFLQLLGLRFVIQASAIWVWD